MALGAHDMILASFPKVWLTYKIATKVTPRDKLRTHARVLLF